ncbi:MAG: hypothetical protein K0S70_599 [Microbacterium sp.]|nr:hypothetical protein [Microbacterium sp.]
MPKEEIGQGLISRRAAVGVIALATMSIATFGDSTLAHAESQPDAKSLVEKCIQAAGDPARASFTEFERDGADVRRCAVDGRWLVLVPGTDRDPDLVESDATVTAVIEVGATMRALSTYRGISFDEAERTGLAQRSGEEKA